jgi:hypothetical protein
MKEELTAKTEYVPQPWHIEFIWHGKSAKITLKKGEDLLKVAEMFSSLLTAHGIENDLDVM